MPTAAPTVSSIRAKHKAPIPDNRPSAAKRGYGGKRWQVLRRQTFMLDGYICQEPDCGKLCRDNASDRGDRPHCDHIIPKSRGGTDAPGNLQTLCGRCHGAKTATEDGGFGNARN